MKHLKRYKHITKVQYLFFCAATLFSLVCWGFWEMMFSVINVLFTLIKGY